MSCAVAESAIATATTTDSMSGPRRVRYARTRSGFLREVGTEGLPRDGPASLDRFGVVDFLGVRHDGGDAETGFSADIGGGVTLAALAEGLTVSLEGRGVLTHEAAGLRDRGFSGTLAWDPPPSTGHGPKLTLSQSLGARGRRAARTSRLSRTTLEGACGQR